MLGLAGSPVDADSLRAITSAIVDRERFKRALSLQFHYSGLGNDGAKALADLIRSTKFLQALTIRQDEISDEGCFAIAESLSLNNSLAYLDLSHNRITEDAAAAVEASLRVKLVVVHVNVEGNSGITGAQRERLARLCESNGRVIRSFDQLRGNYNILSLALWPNALALVRMKPDLLYAFIRTKVDLCQDANGGWISVTRRRRKGRSRNPHG